MPSRKVSAGAARRKLGCRAAPDRALKAAMKHNVDGLAARAAPALFVVLWSTGFIATKYVLRGAERSH
jgi:hypothetical protein